MKLFTAAAVAILLTSGIAYAQDSGGGNSGGGNSGGNSSGNDNGNSGAANSGGGSDASNYLSGPNIQRFYTDESMGTLRSNEEMMSAWGQMTPEEQANMRQACEGNSDTRWSALCTSVGSM